MATTFSHEQYISPFAWRYGSQQMRALWSEQAKRRLWRRVWLALASAQARAGLLSTQELEDIRAHVDAVDIEAAEELEREIRHDLMAELLVFARQCVVGGGKLHLGATSMDIEDNADALRLREALLILERKLSACLRALARRIDELAEAPCLGYTHLQPAEPTTVGYRLALYAQDLWDDLKALREARASIRGKGFKGAVGTSASFEALLHGTGISPRQLEAWAMAELGIEAFPVCAQTYPRKQDLMVVSAIAGLGASAHKFALDLRLLQSPLAGEWQEPFGRRQVGSSAMPFKRNPVVAEKICSLARCLASLVSIAWQNAAESALERTLDDSANRRIVLPEAFLAADEILISLQQVIEGLQFYPAVAARNLLQYGPFAGTERILMEAVRRGANRQELHEVLREEAMHAWAQVQAGQLNPLADRLCQNQTLLQYLDCSTIRSLLDVRNHLGDAPARARQFAADLTRYLDE